MRISLLPVLAALSALAACGSGHQSSRAGDDVAAMFREASSDIAVAADCIDEETLASTIRFLADDLLEGRGVATRGDELSRLYIATQLQQYGMQPGGPDESWEQPVPIIGITAEVDRAMSVSVDGGETITFEAPTDFTAEAAQPKDVTSWSDAPLVFVGYGITAPEQDWDDYKSTDLRGKVALVMNDDPDWDPELFAGETRLYYGRWSYKFEEAARRGRGRRDRDPHDAVGRVIRSRSSSRVRVVSNSGCRSTRARRASRSVPGARTRPRSASVRSATSISMRCASRRAAVTSSRSNSG